MIAREVARGPTEILALATRRLARKGGCLSPRSEGPPRAKGSGEDASEERVMSDKKLDELSKALATTTSRRQMLKILAATAAGGAVSLVGAREAGAAAAEGSGSRAAPTSSAATFSARPTPAGAPAGRARTCAAKTRRCIRCDPEATFDPETCQCVCPEGTTQCGTECCSRRPGVLPRRLLRPDLLPTRRDLLPGRLLLVLRGPVLGT